MPLLRFVEMWVFRQFAHLLPTLLRLLFYEQVFLLTTIVSALIMRSGSLFKPFNLWYTSIALCHAVALCRN